MPKTQATPPIREQIIDAALQCATQKSWADVTLRDIATQAKIELSSLIEVFADKVDIIDAYGRRVDAQVAEVIHGQSMEDDTPRDRLFDVLMERFEIMNEDRAAVLSILNAVTLDPKQMVTSMPWICRSMGVMLDVAEIKSDGWTGALRVAGLSGVYLKVLRDWCKDESADLSATMASLDTALKHADRVAEALNL